MRKKGMLERIWDKFLYGICLAPWFVLGATVVLMAYTPFMSSEKMYSFLFGADADMTQLDVAYEANPDFVNGDDIPFTCIEGNIHYIFSGVNVVAVKPSGEPYVCGIKKDFK